MGHKDNVQAAADALSTAKYRYQEKVEGGLQSRALPTNIPMGPGGGHLHVEPKEGDDLKKHSDGFFCVLKGDYEDFENALQGCEKKADDASNAYSGVLTNKKSSAKQKTEAKTALKTAHDDVLSMMDTLKKSPDAGWVDIKVSMRKNDGSGEPEIVTQKWAKFDIHYLSNGAEKTITLATFLGDWPRRNFEKMIHGDGRGELESAYSALLEKGKAFMPEKDASAA